MIFKCRISLTAQSYETQADSCKRTYMFREKLLIFFILVSLLLFGHILFIYLYKTRRIIILSFIIYVINYIIILENGFYYEKKKP